MRKKIYIVIMIVFLLGVMGCGSNKDILNGKYISAYYVNSFYKSKETTYYEFVEDGTYTTNYSGEDIGMSFATYGTYDICDNKLTLFVGDDPENPDITWNMGYVYKNTLCSKWEGDLPTKKTSIEIFAQDETISFKIYFKEDGTYESLVIYVDNNEIIDKTTGTYEVNKNKVECKNEEGLITTFYDTDDGVYGVDYIKE